MGVSVRIDNSCVCACAQVVNFMSTDTDRIVNFCPSFHQFWSLPFQIAVSLYLLHQQVINIVTAKIGVGLMMQIPRGVADNTAIMG